MENLMTLRIILMSACLLPILAIFLYVTVYKAWFFSKSLPEMYRDKCVIDVPYRQYYSGWEDLDPILQGEIELKLKEDSAALAVDRQIYFVRMLRDASIACSNLYNGTLFSSCDFDGHEGYTRGPFPNYFTFDGLIQVYLRHCWNSKQGYNVTHTRDKYEILSRELELFVLIEGEKLRRGMCNIFTHNPYEWEVIKYYPEYPRRIHDIR